MKTIKLIIVLLVKSLLMLIVLLCLLETNPNAPKFKVGNRVIITKHKNISGKCYTRNWPRERFLIDSVMETNS